MSITVVARIRAKEGLEEEAKKELMALVNPARSEEGCMNYDLHRSADDKSLFLFYENWTSTESFDEHLNTPHMEAFKKKADKLLAEPPDITLWEKIIADDQMVKTESEGERERFEESYIPSEEITERTDMVIVQQIGEEKKECRISEERFSHSRPDNEGRNLHGWDLHGWDLHDTDHTGNNSKSLYVEAVSGFGTITKTASVTVNPGYSSVLRYYRKMELYGANIMSNVTFQVIIDDGSEHIADEITQKFGNYTEGNRIERSTDLSFCGGKTVRLKFVVTVTDPASVLSYARVRIDDITVSDTEGV